MSVKQEAQLSQMRFSFSDDCLDSTCDVHCK